MRPQNDKYQANNSMVLDSGSQNSFILPLIGDRPCLFLLKKIMRKIFTFLYFILVLLPGQKISAQEFIKEHFIYQGDTLPFRIFYPDGFHTEKSYPLILFLHGAGERGNDNEKQLVHGKNFFGDSAIRAQYPAVVIFPQCPINDYWARVEFDYQTDGSRNFDFKPGLEPTKPMSLLLLLLDSLGKTSWLNHQQMYVGGLSMGGMGTFELLYRRPDVFAAAFPICGGGNPDAVAPFAQKVALWVFHGEVDAVVPVQLSVKMVQSIEKEGGRPKFTTYPGVNHNAWDYVFLEKELQPWLFSYQKQSPSQ